MEAYCFKCRKKTEMKNTVAATLKNGKPATKGSCAICDANMSRIGKHS
tara:strand:+ start:348 stop:491 length:144 start_codon:yes stop_codon:yes gene_type:complete